MTPGELLLHPCFRREILYLPPFERYPNRNDAFFLQGTQFSFSSYSLRFRRDPMRSPIDPHPSTQGTDASDALSLPRSLRTVLSGPFSQAGVTPSFPCDSFTLSSSSTRRQFTCLPLPMLPRSLLPRFPRDFFFYDPFRFASKLPFEFFRSACKAFVCTPLPSASLVLPPLDPLRIQFGFPPMSKPPTLGDIGYCRRGLRLRCFFFHPS